MGYSQTLPLSATRPPSTTEPRSGRSGNSAKLEPGRGPAARISVIYCTCRHGSHPDKYSVFSLLLSDCSEPAPGQPLTRRPRTPLVCLWEHKEDAAPQPQLSSPTHTDTHVLLWAARVPGSGRLLRVTLTHPPHLRGPSKTWRNVGLPQPSCLVHSSSAAVGSSRGPKRHGSTLARRRILLVICTIC